MNKEIPEFESFEQLRQAVERTMPDEYPVGFAAAYAESMLKDGRAKIKDGQA
jgi:hypothetical protein